MLGSTSLSGAGLPTRLGLVSKKDCRHFFEEKFEGAPVLCVVEMNIERARDFCPGQVDGGSLLQW